MFPFGFSKLFNTMQVNREGIPEIQVGNSEYIQIIPKGLTVPLRHFTQLQINIDGPSAMPVSTDFQTWGL